MTQMPAMGEIQAHNPVAGIQDPRVNIEIGRRSTKRLDIDPPFLRIEVESG